VDARGVAKRTSQELVSRASNGGNSRQEQRQLLGLSLLFLDWVSLQSDDISFNTPDMRSLYSILKLIFYTSISDSRQPNLSSTP
jgi:hypothetical protein